MENAIGPGAPPDYQGELADAPSMGFRVNRRVRMEFRRAADPDCTQCGGRGGRTSIGVLHPCRCAMRRLNRRPQPPQAV